MKCLSRILQCMVYATMLLGFGPPAHAQTSPSGSIGSRSSSADVNVSYEGFSEAIQDVYISTEEVGQLVEVPVNLGQAVRKGDMIAQLDDRLERAAVTVSRVQASMEGEIAAAKATRTLQAYRLEQLRQLRADQMAGADEIRRTEAELAVADARWLIAREQKELRQAELQRLELQVERRKLRAPFDAIVAEKRLDKGDAVTPSTSVVLRLIRSDQLLGVFNVPAEKSFSMEVGMAAQVFLRAARQTVDGVIESISPLINGESGTVEVRVQIENADGILRPGDRCSMRISPLQQMTQVKVKTNY